MQTCLRLGLDLRPGGGPLQESQDGDPAFVSEGDRRPTARPAKSPDGRASAYGIQDASDEGVYGATEQSHGLSSVGPHPFDGQTAARPVDDGP